ncbi:MAG: hypothetical protein JXX29_22580 [Deltaproteobacteria bacterium]|nr:hypothetical protein [Deltaproteobacteria bacterium]MBN2674484.1 hypothetical protein [Deltaproteobacteria bacterium]
MIHGSSLVSLDYVLAYYGLIPERVHIVTSVTSGRAKMFDTPIGGYVYRPTPCLEIGFDRISTDFHLPFRSILCRLFLPANCTICFGCWAASIKFQYSVA